MDSLIPTSTPPVSCIDEIVPNTLYLGSIEALSDLSLLRLYNITHVLSLTSTPISALPPSTGITHVHYKVSDTRTQNLLSFLLSGLHFIESAQLSFKPSSTASEVRVFVHCRAGVSRSASVVIAYVMKHFCLPYPAALEYVRKKRRIVNPNRGFVSQLTFLGECGFDVEGLLDGDGFGEVDLANPYDPEEERGRAGGRRREGKPWHREPWLWVSIKMDKGGRETVKWVLGELERREKEGESWQKREAAQS